MNKETGTPIKVNGKEVTAEKTFIAKKANGTVDITFRLDSRELDEKTIVVFEDLYHNGIKVTSHADITDKDQSITYPKKPEPPVNVPQTGDTTHLLVYAGLAAASIAAVTTLLIRRRKKHDDDITE